MGKKLHFFLILQLLLSQLIFSQNEGNTWYFGSNAGLDFNSGIPVSLPNGQINCNEGAATISDSSGQLLFYTDGITVWNKDHVVMPNGTGLMGSSTSSQAAIIIPKPGSCKIYYIFTCEESGNVNGFRYSEVNLSLEGGKGDVTSTKNILLTTPVCEKVTAVRKTDNSGYWVLTHSFPNNNFLAFSVTSSGVNINPVVSSAGLPITEYVQTVGHLKISPCGTKLVSCSFKQKLEMFDFNASTGVVSNPRVLNNKLANYGAEFSPSGDVLYITTGNEDYVFDLVQYDLTVANVPASAVNLKTNIPYQFGALQLGPDGKIYAAIINSNYMAYIDQPEVIGMGCNFIKNGIHLGNGQSTFGLPQFIQSYFKSSSEVQMVCYGNAASFSLPSELNITNAHWEFGDGNTSNQITATHQYALPGLYEAMVTAQGNTGIIVKKWQVIVSETPVVNRISNQIACGGPGTAYNLKKNNATILGSQNPNTFHVDYFLSQANAIAHTNVLSSTYNLPSGTTNFYAKIYNAKNKQCYQIANFTVTLINQLTTGQVSDYTICESQPNDYIEIFNLSTKSTEILNGLNGNQFTITYHDSQTDADNDTGALPYVYTNTTPQEIIYVRLENKDDPTCYATTSFVIKVVQQPVIGVISPLLECGDSSGNGTAVFDLSQKTTEVLGGLSPTMFNVTYHLSFTDANNGANPITTPYVNEVNNQTIYVAVNSIGNACKAIGSFTLVVTSKPIRHRSRNIRVCDGTIDDGKEVFDFSNQTIMMLNEQFSGQYVVTYHISNADAQNDENSLSLNYQNISNPQTIYTRIENVLNPDCFDVSSFEIQVDRLPLATKPGDINLCSDEFGKYVANVELHTQDSAILNGQSDSEFTVSYYTSLENAVVGESPLNANYQSIYSTQHIFARVNNSNNPKCFAITDFEVTVYAKPFIEMEEVYSFCQNSTILITAPSGFDKYSWSTGATTKSIVVDKPMNISLTVTNNYGEISCDSTVEFSVVESSVAIIKEVEINDWTENQNSIRIITNSNGDYEYSIDGINYQESPYFYGLEMGQHTVYVKDKNQCGIVTQDIYLLIYPKYFTPNGDGLHERWQIKFAQSEPNLEVTIFDKYGRLVTSFDGKSEGWDGTCNNVTMPSADYWFVVRRESGIAYRGHFSLLR